MSLSFSNHYLFNEQRYLLTQACHIIVNLKLDSGPFGNISIRIPETNQFWVNPTGLIFSELNPEDMVRVDVQGNVLEGDKEAHPGTFIHREIYRLRPDVQAIVHTHSDHTATLSLLGCEIEPFTQLGAALYADQGVYRGFSGPVRTINEGLAIAEALADKSIVIAKNHGLFSVGTTIQAALWDFVVADAAAKIHLTARQLGFSHAEKLSNELMHKSRVEVRDKQCQFMWNSYLKRITA